MRSSKTYLRIETWTLTVQEKLGKTVYKILKNLHGGKSGFLKSGSSPSAAQPAICRIGKDSSRRLVLKDISF